MAARIVPDTGDVPVGTGLDMAPEGRRPAPHERVGRFADMRRERVRLLVGRKRVLEDGVKRHEGHRGLRTRLRTIIETIARIPGCPQQALIV